MPRMTDRDLHEMLDSLCECKSFEDIEYVLDEIRDKFHHVPANISSIALHFKDVLYHTSFDGRYIPMPYETSVKYVNLIHSMDNLKDANKFVHEVFMIYNHVPGCIWTAIDGLKQRLKEENKLDNIEEE